jgi:hypothetical protein
MNQLIIPKTAKCSGYFCPKSARLFSFCTDCWSDIPDPLKHEFKGAFEEGKRQKRITNRLKVAFENAMLRLAEVHKQRAIDRKYAIDKAAREAQVLAEAEERLAAAPEAAPKR